MLLPQSYKISLSIFNKILVDYHKLLFNYSESDLLKEKTNIVLREPFIIRKCSYVTHWNPSSLFYNFQRKWKARRDCSTNNILLIAHSLGFPWAFFKDLYQSLKCCISCFAKQDCLENFSNQSSKCVPFNSSIALGCKMNFRKVFWCKSSAKCHIIF